VRDRRKKTIALNIVSYFPLIAPKSNLTLTRAMKSQTSTLLSLCAFVGLQVGI